MLADSLSYDDELRLVVDLMRAFSRETDPQAAATMYSRGLRRGLLPSDEYVAVSRRGLEYPNYRITRSTTWREPVNPWKDRERLPLLSGGLLAELIYSDQPVLIDDLPARLSPDDPAREYLEGFQLIATLPHFDDGVALNMGCILLRDASRFPRDRYPVYVWQGNLYGRATLNMVLRQELKAAYDRLDAELRSVGDIQRSLLPAELPAIETLDLAAYYETSTRAGGDYYDLFDLGDGRWGILIADVSGHSTPAAVVMAITHAVAHLHPGGGADPSELLAFVNHQLVTRYTTGTGTFVTAFYGVFDARRRTLAYAVAGHNPPRLLRAGSRQAVDLDGASGLPLGIESPEHYPRHEVELSAGDAMLFYTDGITEARNDRGEMFGAARLDKALAGSGGSARRLLGCVLACLREFTGTRPQGDDQTMLAAVVR